MSPIIEELDSLLFDWEAGTLDESSVKRVRDILRSDEGARRFFLQQQSLTAALKMEGDAGTSPPDFERVTSPGTSVSVEEKNSASGVRSKKSSRRFVWLAAAAAVAMICVQAARILHLERTVVNGKEAPQTPVLADEEKSYGVALVTQLVDIKWADGQSALEVGDAVALGNLAIEAGYAQLEFFCGATVILEGPAELDLKSPTLARVRSGRLRAQVPPAARGFSLEVEELTVVDLGTEFGLSVSSDGANVQVFDGEVELREPSEENRLLTTGQAVIRDRSGKFANVDVTPDSFVDITTLEARVQGQQSERYQRWKAWSKQVRRDSRLITYYAFDQQDEWMRRLECSLDPSNSELDGAIVGASQVPGRWPSKRGLEFKRPGDRVRVQIPGDYGSLTLTAWVKIDSLDRQFNSLFLTDNYNRGEPHWQILESGQLYFSVRPAARADKGPRDYKALSPSFWNPALSGRWIHLATVYNMELKRITHFLNGEVLSRDSVPENQVVPTHIGTASIGNWSSPTLPDASFAIRNLNGSIDEFLLFAAALSDDEIRETYENGKP